MIAARRAKSTVLPAAYTETPRKKKIAENVRSKPERLDAGTAMFTDHMNSIPREESDASSR
jgi:hypothetical protein